MSAPSERAGQLRKLPRTQALLRTHTHLGPGSGRLTLKRVSCHAQGGGPTRHSVGSPPWGGAPRPARARADPRSSPLFAPRPRSTWVSLRTARQVVKPNVEELRARPAHKDRRSGAGARDAGRLPRTQALLRTHTHLGPGIGQLTRKRVSCHAQAPIQGGVRLNPLCRTPLSARLERPWPAHAAPRSSPLFAPCPGSSWVSRQTARQVVT